MSSALNNKKRIKLILTTTAGLVGVVLCFFLIQGSVWSGYDYTLLDVFYKNILLQGHGPKSSTFPQIKYVTITDDTYAHIKKNYLDRSFLAGVNIALTELGARAIAYDIIFAHPTGPAQDQAFLQSLDHNGSDGVSDEASIYLPMGLNLSSTKQPFKWKTGTSHGALKRDHLKHPIETGESRPFYGTWALMQYESFTGKTINSGHISSHADPDGITRHLPLLIKIEDGYLPALSLTIFLDYMGIDFGTIRVEWGKQITIPAAKDSFLDQDLIIPMDKKGLVFIPFPQTWEKDFDEMPSHKLMESIKDENLAGNLSELFEGNIVFIGDISTGISDLGHIPFQNHVPLIMTHTAMLNGMLTHTFYKKTSFVLVIGLVIIMGICIGLAALWPGSWPLYLTGAGLFLGTIVFTWLGFMDFYLFPIASVLISLVVMVSGLVITLGYTASRDRTYIKNMFTRYVPKKIVNHLLINPQLIKLGGETREISMMMSDLRGFTALSASRKPEEVIFILNRYFDTMIDIIMDHSGVIDEIIGDGILGFFGAPEKTEDHPARAVACALAMQKAMPRINAQNKAEGLPELEMGIAVNTGKVVLGNIGSEKRTKYGAVGAEVNFTGRVESYTVGGQVLITRSTYKKLANLAQIENTMEVEMKGMTGKARLYNVTGMGAPFNIFLTTKEETLIKLDPTIDITIFRLKEKTVSSSGILAQITHLSASKAKILVPETLAPWENIRFQIMGRHTDHMEADPVGGEVYAKVTETEQRHGQCDTRISLTSVSPEADQIFLKIFSAE